MTHSVSMHGSWSSRWVFILAATGSAVGLGNIWKFPYMAGEYGGGAFVLVYLLCVAMIGIPVMMAEIMLGRRGRKSPINAMRDLAEEASQHPAWAAIGWMGVAAGFMILSFYSVVGGWALSYVPEMISGSFNADTSKESAGAAFDGLIGSPTTLTIWHTIFIFLTAFVIARGVEKGLEKAVKFLMPALFLLLLSLVAYAMFSTDKFMDGINFMFNVDFDKLFYPKGDGQFSGEGVLAAMGQAFFSLSVGMGAIMMYGAYLPKDTAITPTTVIIAGADTLVALLAGLAIFPIVFANGLDAGSGPGLVFITLPIAFGHMPGGIFFGTLFFVLLTFAAWTSAISILEPSVAWLVESWHWSRKKAAILCSIAIWALGMLSVFSLNILKDFHPFVAGQTLFDNFQYITSNIMLPLGGLLIAIFAAWMMERDAHHDELHVKNGGADISYKTWLFLIRFVTPVGVSLVFLSAIGVFSV